MKIFLAGATGAIGRRLVPLLLNARHHVVGTTRSTAKADGLRAVGVRVRQTAKGGQEKAPTGVRAPLSALPNRLKRVGLFQIVDRSNHRRIFETLTTTPAVKRTATTTSISTEVMWTR
jgi:nucleoside-diphosphate-sugar epimerase